MGLVILLVVDRGAYKYVWRDGIYKNIIVWTLHLMWKKEKKLQRKRTITLSSVHTNIFAEIPSSVPDSMKTPASKMWLCMRKPGLFVIFGGKFEVLNRTDKIWKQHKIIQKTELHSLPETDLIWLSFDKFDWSKK